MPLFVEGDRTEYVYILKKGFVDVISLHIFFNLTVDNKIPLKRFTKDYILRCIKWPLNEDQKIIRILYILVLIFCKIATLKAG